MLYQRADAEKCDQFLQEGSKAFPRWALAQHGKEGLPRDVPELWAAPQKAEFIQVTENTVTIHYLPEPELPFKTMELTLTLYESRPEIRFDLKATGKKPDLWPEAGYFRFPLNIANPQFRLGRLGGIADPAKDFARSSGLHFQWLRTGVAVFGEDGYGVGVCPLETPLVSLDRPGGWLFSSEFIPAKANVYFNLFNNQWTTNFRLWNSDDVMTSFVLWTFDEYDSESSLITPSLETLALNYSMQPIKANLPEQWTRGIAVNRKGIYVTAFGKDVDTGDLMLRLWEMAGKGQDAPDVEITLPPGMEAESVMPCDLRGRPVAPRSIPIRDGKFTVPVRPYSPVNLRIEGHRL